MSDAVPLDELVLHRYRLDRTPEALSLNSRYEGGAQKVMVDVASPTLHE